jgi:hypothetical protein
VQAALITTITIIPPIQIPKHPASKPHLLSEFGCSTVTPDCALGVAFIWSVGDFAANLTYRDFPPMLSSKIFFFRLASLFLLFLVTVLPCSAGSPQDQFFSNIADHTAHEQITEERRDSRRNIRNGLQAEDSYLILRRGGEIWGHVTEYRVDSKGNPVEEIGLSKGYFDSIPQTLP